MNFLELIIHSYSASFFFFFFFGLLFFFFLPLSSSSSSSPPPPPPSAPPNFPYNTIPGCIDIDECTTSKPCSLTEFCTNSEGSYSCGKCDQICHPDHGCNGGMFSRHVAVIINALSVQDHSEMVMECNSTAYRRLLILNCKG